MFYYDLRCHDRETIGESSVEELVKMAKRLGLAGIGIVRTLAPNEDIKNIKWPAANADIDIIKAILIKPTNVEELNKMISKVRDHVEVLMVDGGILAVNRAACETSAVDVLCNPQNQRRDSGLDHISVKMARDNNVAIEVNLHEIIESYKKHRVYALSYLRRNVFLCQKYGTPIVTTSASVSKWHMRSGRQLASLTNILGLELTDAVASVSTIPEAIVQMNRKKLRGEAMDGVELV